MSKPGNRPRSSTQMARAILATAHGAELILAPMDVPAAGRMAVIRDPQGAVLTLLVPEDPLA